MKFSRCFASPVIEFLESRDLLTASPEPFFDFNSNPGTVRDGNVPNADAMPIWVGSLGDLELYSTSDAFKRQESLWAPEGTAEGTAKLVELEQLPDGIGTVRVLTPIDDAA